MNTTLQIRVDKKTKKEAQKVFKDLGIDMSSGIKLYLSKVINTGSIPFIPRTKNGFTEAQEKEILKEVEYALKYGKRYSSVDEAFDDILK